MNILHVFGRHRPLAIELTRREILGRYRGASFGLLWSLISPFMMLMVYTVAFGFILKARWPGARDNYEFALVLFAGLIVHGFFAECLTRAPQVIVGNANFVKRVVFPLDLLVWSMALTALFHLGMNTLVLLALQLATQHLVHATALLLPFVVAPLVVLCVGVGWILAAFGVYLRDIGQMVGVVATAMLFLSSAIVPVDAVSEQYRWLFYLNPLTFIIDQTREVVIWGRMPDWQGLGTYAACAVGVALVGHALFGRLRRGFADVL
jgi:lipopolysaccharide transport system permease protein